MAFFISDTLCSRIASAARAQNNSTDTLTLPQAAAIFEAKAPLACLNDRSMDDIYAEKGEGVVNVVVPKGIYSASISKDVLSINKYYISITAPVVSIGNNGDIYYYIDDDNNINLYSKNDGIWSVASAVDSNTIFTFGQLVT